MDATRYPGSGTDCDVDHLFGPYLAVDVVMDPQMPSKSCGKSHLGATRRLNHRGFASFQFRVPKARRAREGRSGQTGSELPKCHP